MKPALGVTRLRILEAVMLQPGISYSELVERFQIQRNALYGHLTALREQGLVTWEVGKARTLRATCRWIPAEAT